MNVQDNLQYIAIFVAIVLVLLSYILLSKKKTSTQVILLLGLPDSGKTTLLTKILFNTPKKTVTSLKENAVDIEGKNLRLIDVPGSDRLRDRYWEQYRTVARHILFVIDCSSIEEKLHDLGEYIYTLLSDGIVHRNHIRFTVVLGKQDLIADISKASIKSSLEKELNAIKSTKRGQLAKTSNEKAEDYLSINYPDGVSLDSLKVGFIDARQINQDELLSMI